MREQIYGFEIPIAEIHMSAPHADQTITWTKAAIGDIYQQNL